MSLFENNKYNNINIKYIFYLMETKEQLVNNIKEWIKIDTEISQLNASQGVGPAV